MAKISITDLKQSVTTLNVPVKKPSSGMLKRLKVILSHLKIDENNSLELGDIVELEADIFVKKMNFKESREASKAIEWDLNYENLEDSKVKKIDSTHMQAAQLLGSICSDQKGTPFSQVLMTSIKQSLV